MNDPSKVRIDWGIFDNIVKTIEEGEEIIKSKDTCKAGCWIEKSNYLMSLNWDVILKYQAMRDRDIARILDDLANVTLGVMDTACRCG